MGDICLRVEKETLLTVRQAGNEFPGRPSTQTIWRWMHKGVRGVVLESVLIGGHRYTSREAIGRFILDQNNENVTEQKQDRERRIRQAMQVLDSLGIEAQSK